MAARNIFHELVKKALINEGWNITHDPFKIMMGRRRGYMVSIKDSLMILFLWILPTLLM
ncbi:MAG: element excision factor XisH family protein [Runella zeae]